MCETTVDPHAFKPLEFHKIAHAELRPPIGDYDHTSDDYNRGELLSLFHAHKALQLVVRVVPGRDAKDWPVAQAEVGFFLMEQQGRYIGGISRQIPERFCYLYGAGEDVRVIGNTKERPPALGGRTRGTFFCAHSYGGYPRTLFSIAVLIRRSIFGGWKEVVIETPKKSLYVAHP
jgi:hypothetical protein